MKRPKETICKKPKAVLCEVVRLKSEMDMWSDSITGLFGGDTESMGLRPPWRLFDAYLKQVEKVVGDDAGWVEWFVWENGCGAKALEAGRHGRMKPVRTVDDLVKLIKK